jgi:hypothetical protein
VTAHIVRPPETAECAETAGIARGASHHRGKDGESDQFVCPRRGRDASVKMVGERARHAVVFLVLRP